MLPGNCVTLHELIQRATDGKGFDRQALFRPSLVYQVLHDPFWLWCEYHAPRSEAVDETTRHHAMRKQRGIAHEQAWVRTHYPDAVQISPEFGFEALRNTLRVMLEGPRAIYQPQLWDLGGEVYGRGDLLVRDDTRTSDLGPHHYRLVEIKWSKALQDYHVLDAGFYNRMLGRIQGYAPPEVTVALREDIATVPFSETEKTLDEIIARWRLLREGTHMPEPGRPPDAAESPWRVYGNRFVATARDLVLLAGIGSREREMLRAAGIHRVDHLWDRSLRELSEILGDKYGPQAYHVAQAYMTGRPILRPGSRLSIPRAPRHLYFDFECSDDLHPTEPPHVYLIGCWDAQENRYERFLAKGASDEGRIFQEFVAYVGDVESAGLYHWTDYEVGEMGKVIQRWPDLEAALTTLMASCVDLKEVIKSAVYLPVPSFSIKSVAPALGFAWRQENFGAFEAMACYWDYLDGADDSAIEKAIRYNEDDCRAMWHVDHQLTTRLAQV